MQLRNAISLEVSMYRSIQLLIAGIKVYVCIYVCVCIVLNDQPVALHKPWMILE